MEIPKMCKIKTTGIIDHTDFKLNDFKEMKQTIVYYKNDIHYIKSIIESIKDNVIRKFKNLNLIEINLSLFDKNNKVHYLLVQVFDFINKITNLKKINSYKIIFITIKYDGKIVFIGGCD